MTKPLTVQELIDRITAAWGPWRESLRPCKLSELETAEDGSWSLKDTMAHISWHEQEMIKVINAKALVGSDWWLLPLDERNQKIYELYKDDDVRDVLLRLDSIHAELMTALPTLTDADLFAAARFADMPPDWEPWSLLANNTYEHYEAHFQE